MQHKVKPAACAGHGKVEILNNNIKSIEAVLYILRTIYTSHVAVSGIRLSLGRSAFILGREIWHQTNAPTDI